MTKAERAHARGKRVSARTSVRAKPKAKPHANSRTKHLPKSQARPHGNLIVFSPELIADGKRRYETTLESLDSVALGFSTNRSTLRNIAKRENWVRYVAPPRGMSRAADIAAKAAALEAETLNDRHPEVRGLWAEPRRATAELSQESAVHPSRLAVSAVTRVSDTLWLAPQDDGEGVGGGETSAAAPPATLAWSMRERIDALRGAVDEEIAAVRALRASLKGVPHSTETAGRTSRTLADLTTTLERLHRLEIGASQHNGQDTYADKFSDIPADPDAFRDELARRIRAFVAGRVGPRDADRDSGPAGVDEVR